MKRQPTLLPGHHESDFPGYVTAHEDSAEEYEYAGMFRVLSSRFNQQGFDSGHSIVRVRAPLLAAPQAINESMYAHFTHGCRCSHDCCGHWQTQVITVRHAKRREWLVEINHYRNV